MKNTLFLFIILVFIFSCSPKKENKPDKKTKETTSAVVEQKKKINLSKPGNYQNFIIGDLVDFSFELNDSVKPDSFRISIDNQLIETKYDESYQFSWNSIDSRTGTLYFSIEVFKANKRQNVSGNIILYSDVIPEKKSYKIINTYPHDIYAYTQGLKYEKGFLYEGTGQWGQSSLRKIKLETGELVQSYKLPSDVFGEGITFYNEKIIQLTWKSWVGYVYDKEQFKMLYKFNYPVPIEGWGVEFNGTHLIVSDGTNNLMFFNPDSFTEDYRIQVYDNNGPVDSINELEYIDGKLYANIYMSDKIVMIDPVKGKVLQEINMSGLLKDKDKHPNIDVLNGIAFDKENKRFFVTGKYWPKLYEIKFI